ncbi:hypothetical protein [Microvirga zambiensis]|uniref:hypothetical protein n=1 Tax=Microvirga zambiensis TaxID=1402137 RepID=UPI00191EDADF|nr:hypothetical protein [Microvirga zambiensis]
MPWNNGEADHDPQEPSAPETDTASVAKIAGQARSHFKRKVKAAVLNQADLLRNEMTKEDETIAMTVIVRLKRGEIPP